MRRPEFDDVHMPDLVRTSRLGRDHQLFTESVSGKLRGEARRYDRAFHLDLAIRRARAGAGELNWSPLPVSA